MLRRVVMLWALFALMATSASAQAPEEQQAPQATNDTASETRPATTTFYGDTGLWFVPTAEILPAGRWSVSGYRANFDREQGFTDYSHFAVTIGYGIGDRAELFTSWRLVTRIDRDIRPIFVPSLSDSGGLAYEYPFVTDGWTGNKLGDLILGAKFNVTAEHRQSPAAFAIRTMVKLPTGDDDDGVSTDKLDFYVDAIVSKEINQRVEWSGFGGVVLRGSPDQVDIPSGFRWGIGAGFPSRSSLRMITELHGEMLFSDTVEINEGFLIGSDGSLAPQISDVDGPIDATIGLQYQARGGFFIGAGINYAFTVSGRDDSGGEYSGETGDVIGFQVRMGYHPGVKIYVPPPPPPPAPTIDAPVNRPPTVKAQCNPCTIEVCKASTVTADANDPDGDTLTYKWTAPTGTLASPAAVSSMWTAPCEPGPVPVTVMVDDGKGGTASDTVTIQVIRPAVKEFVFEDVHFDFDRYTLRPDAARILDEAVKALQENKELRIEVEGHTCNIGTAEYNLALGERRATAVRDYLATRGVVGDRLRTVSYGEERPKHENAREETRRLNRRAALVVRVQ